MKDLQPLLFGGFSLVVIAVLGFGLAGIKRLRPYKLRTSMIITVSWFLFAIGAGMIFTPFWIYSDLISSAPGGEILSPVIYGLVPILVLAILYQATKEAYYLWRIWPWYRF